MTVSNTTTSTAIATTSSSTSTVISTTGVVATTITSTTATTTIIATTATTTTVTTTITTTTATTTTCSINTYWNGSICLPQLLQNQTCSQANVCRSDLNLTCQASCDFTYRCSLRKSIEFYFHDRFNFPAIGVGQTVAGYCNGGTSGNATKLNGPWGIYVSTLDGTV
ncbi:unnamed protein product, partial [Adineta ricciae]